MPPFLDYFERLPRFRSTRCSARPGIESLRRGSAVVETPAWLLPASAVHLSSGGAAFQGFT